MNQPTTTPTTPTLTNREKELMELFSNGYSIKEISHLCFISFHTVDAHRRNLLQKLGARNIAHAVKLAVGSGVIKM